MFPQADISRPTDARRPPARGWEAMDRAVGGSPSARDAPRSWRAVAGRALGLACAFLTLEDAALTVDVSRPLELAEPLAHPHRQPLRPTLRSRRPGAVAPRAQHCLTPVIRAPADGRPAAGRVPGWLPR